jgi:hypothetical protein
MLLPTKVIRWTAAVLMLWTAFNHAVQADTAAVVPPDGAEACMELKPDGTMGECQNNIPPSKDAADLLSQEPTLISELIAWIQDNGGIVDSRQEVRRDDPTDVVSPRRVYATSTIPRGTTLVSVPWKLIVSPDDPEETNLCETVHVLKRELEKFENDPSESLYAPYLKLLNFYNSPMLLPDGWSDSGQELLKMITGAMLPPQHIGSHLEWYENSCGGNRLDEIGKKAALLTIGYRTNGFKTPDLTQDSYQEVMMPFFDLYSHRDGHYYNTQLEQFDVGSDIVIAASRTIEAGEPIHGSVGFGTPLGTPRLLQDGGMVEELPQMFDFRLTDSHGLGHTIQFELHEPETEEERLKLKQNQTLIVNWPNGRPTHDQALTTLEAELERLEALSEVLMPDASYMAAVPKHERDLVNQYHNVLMTAMRNAISAEVEPFSWSPFTQTDYEVAGVNLGTYKMTGDEQDDVKPSNINEPPFELYEDFDISDMILGHEGWKEILAYRNKLERPSLSFYVDKVARKRWLPLNGFDQPHLFALNYAHELTETGDVEDEKNVIYRLLPNNTDYAAKPGHYSETNGIWLVSRDLETNETIVSSTARQLIPDEDKTFDNWVVAESIAKNLHGKAKPYESWALKNVKPGFVVEERLVDFNRWDRPPLELCIFVIWGRVWCGQLNYIEEQNRFFGAFIYRNGTTVKGSFHKKIPFDWLDWPELVRQAEELAKHKDMFRAVRRQK